MKRKSFIFAFFTMLFIISYVITCSWNNPYKEGWLAIPSDEIIQPILDADNFTATPILYQIELNWNNPTFSDFAGG
ncbi:MAG: hypothetical protein KAT05_01970 [Spirochaetes bacterium]|nr:hypothetical protein [Spirochaetota bacterium]